MDTVKSYVITGMKYVLKINHSIYIMHLYQIVPTVCVVYLVKQITCILSIITTYTTIRSQFGQ